MKTLVLLSLSLAVSLGMPVSPPSAAQDPALTDQSPLLGDLVSLQGHEGVESPSPHPGLSSQGPLNQQVSAEAEAGQEETPEQPPGGKVPPEVTEGPQPGVAVEPEAEPEATPGHEVPVEEHQGEPQVDPEELPDDTEGRHEMKAEPAVNSEQLTDTGRSKEEPNDAELAEIEESIRAAFLGAEHVNDPLPVEEGPNSEVEPEITEVYSESPQSIEDVDEWEEGSGRDVFAWPLSEDYYPDNDERLRMTSEPLPDFPTEEESNILKNWGAGRTFVETERLFQELEVEDNAVREDGAPSGVAAVRKRRSLTEEGGERPEEGQSEEIQDNQEPRHCSGVTLEGKCYIFFSEPKKAADAEFYCQTRFPGGHLAAVTSQHVHRELMALMKRDTGAYTRTWVGGLRFLDTGRFIWLDGSHWVYADWLSGEPNNTADVEHCLELLPFGNGKFNDFTCWEPQAFICSFSSQ